MEQLFEFFKTYTWLGPSILAVASAIYTYVTNKSQKKFEAQLQKNKAQFQADIARQLKEKDVEFEKDLTQFKEDLQKQVSQTSELRESLSTIYGSLMTMLLQVQNLNVKFSTICADDSCLEEEIIAFSKQSRGTHETLSKHAAFLPPQITEHIFSFFQYTSFLIIDLQRIKKEGFEHFKYAHACTYVFSRTLTVQLIEMQSQIFKTVGQDEIDIYAHSEGLSSMIHRCGSEPDSDFLKEFCSIYNNPPGLKSEYSGEFEDDFSLYALPSSFEIPKSPEPIESRKVSFPNPLNEPPIVVLEAMSKKG